MSDQLRIAGNFQPISNQGATPALAPTPARAQGALSGYQSGQEVGQQAKVSKPMGGAEFRSALARLDQAVSDDKPFRTDVPRGYYLNIRV